MPTSSAGARSSSTPISSSSNRSCPIISADAEASLRPVRLTERFGRNGSWLMTFEYVLLLVLATLWGASYSLIKVGVETIPPVTLIAGRTLIAAALLLAIMHWRGLGLPRDGETWRRFLIQACLNSAIPF